jgi:hypothetical protein
VRIGLIILLAGLMQGCIAPQHANLEVFNAHQPRSIVVAPVVNESPEVTANSVFITSITQPLAERGYYVFPVYLTDMILRDLGLVEAGHIHQLPTERFYELFGADAVLLITIKDWSTKYLGLVSSVAVSMEYILKDTKTGEVLWKNNQGYVQSSGGSDLISMAVSAAINALITDYLPLARQANFLAFQPPKGLPAGPYHPQYQQDKEQF